MCCGRRFGKDVYQIRRFVEVAAATGREVGWFQPTYKGLLDVWRAVKRYTAPAALKVSEQDKRIELLNGAVLEFWSLEDPDVARGRRYALAVLNECAMSRYLETAWTFSIRLTLTDYRGEALFGSTPRGKEYFWQLWRRGQTDDETFDPDWYSAQLPTSANPFIDEAEVRELERTLPSAQFRQEVLAEFLDQSGKFFDEFEPTHHYTDWDEALGQFVQRSEPWHVVDAPPKVNRNWRFWVSVDYGTSATAPTWWAGLNGIDENGDVWTLEEIYEAGKIDIEQTQLILEMLERWGLASPRDPEDRDGVWEVARWHGATKRDGGLETVILPPDAFNPPINRANPKVRGVAPADTYRDRGLPVIPADGAEKNGRARRWSTAKRWLHATRTVQRDDEEWAIPRWRVVGPKCPNLVRTLPELIEDPNEPEDIEQAPKQEDHPADGWSYGLHTVIPHPGLSEDARREKMEREAQESVERAQREKYRIRLNKPSKSTDY